MLANRSPANGSVSTNSREKKCSGWWFMGYFHLFGFDHETSAKARNKCFVLQKRDFEKPVYSWILDGLSWDAFIDG